MSQIFEDVINSYLEDSVGIVDQFINVDLAIELKKNLIRLFFERQFKQAGIGNKLNLSNNKLIRSDVIYWLDRAHDDVHENGFFDLMDEFVSHLNATCFAGITDYEFHYAYYEKGSFYKRHLDQFKDDQKRAFSMIMYLNEDWMLADGGQLRIYHEESTQTIGPTSGKCVFFKSSELEHEVLLSHKPRMSITGWLKTN